MGKLFLLGTFVFMFFLGHSQQSSESATEEPIDYTLILKKYLEENPPQDARDSSFMRSFTYLDNFVTSDSVSDCFTVVKQLLATNKPHHEILKLSLFREKIDSLNELRHKYLTDYWNRVRLQAMVDTGDISSLDSLFFEALDVLIYQDTVNIDSILKDLSPYDDTLLRAIDFEVERFKKDAFVQWIKTMRNDTVNFYIVDLEGDSLLVRLYQDSPDFIRFGITDYWGTVIPAVIRDIEKRSFRILIDDTPELNYQTAEKAKRAIGGMGKIQKKRKLTVERIPVNIKKPLWIYGGNTNLDMSQVGMHQWAQGGEPTISILAGLELFLNYKKNNANLENKGRFRYGVMRQGRYAQDSIPFRSNEDRIELSSKFGYKAFGQYYASFEGDFKSQFRPNYEWNGNIKGDKISAFMSPAYLIFSLGLDYKPDDNTTLFLSPLSSKTTYVLDTSVVIKERYAVAADATSRREIGMRLKASHKFNFWGNIEIKNTLELFSNYLNKPENVDINWEMALIFPVNDFIRATIATNYIYDDDTKVPRYKLENGVEVRDYTSPGGQFREMITVGFAMKF